MTLHILLGLTVFNTLSLFILAISKYRELTKATLNQVIRPSTELADFLDDIKRHGYAVVRVDPDSLLMRSPRG